MKDRILQEIKARVNRKSWELWFSSFDVKSIENNKVIFSVGNLFIKEWLEKKYHSVLIKAVKSILGNDASYELTFESFEPHVSYSEPLVKRKAVLLTPLNPDYTFENFVVGPGNSFAYHAALEVAKQPGRYNPLFIYGGVGLGKTHLLQSIGNYVVQNEPNLRVMYITSEKFLNDLVDSMKEGKLTEFREKYRRKVDILLIDDIQFLVGKTGVQTELFHTFNELYDSGKQIVICSDREPHMLKEFQDRLISRFQMGLVAKLEPPDEETRKNIAKKMLEIENGELPEEVLNFVAENVDDNLRRLKGAIIKLLVYKETTGKEINLREAVSLLRDFIKPREMKILDPMDELLDILSRIMGIPKEEILSSSRNVKAITARRVGMYVAKTYLKNSLRSIAEKFNRSHPVVADSVKRVKNSLLKGNRQLKSIIDEVVGELSRRALNG
ncbi:chromosomal replication initiator protein DnaA [Thermotoga sp. KOL6]|uniref:chromosomal replication initiator protein DnaA n=1 Tax=Thermotoga sp. KOL6 TaxID=126741 RepID=UPI000C77C9F5|nr:chromosomal replication initiator protein DnaA [Thermotoga sp. KOL6]PLV59730.1 chromosomal replication initiation protein [Thermotoga sp. KOL6]